MEYTFVTRFINDFNLYNGVWNQSPENLQFDRVPNKTLMLMTKCSKIVKNQFNPIFKQIFLKLQHLNTTNKKEIFELLIPLSSEFYNSQQYFTSFVIILTFLNECKKFFRLSRRCWYIDCVISFISQAIYWRLFYCDFESHGGFEGLKTFCKSIIRKNEIKVINRFDSEFLDYIIEKYFIYKNKFTLNHDDINIMNNLNRLSRHANGYDILKAKWPPTWDDVMQCKDVIQKYFNEDLFIYQIRLFDCFKQQPEPIVDFEYDLEKYFGGLEIMTEKKLGSKLFKEEMITRKCPCCKMQCYLIWKEKFDDLYSNFNGPYTSAISKFVSHFGKCAYNILNPVINI